LVIFVTRGVFLAAFLPGTYLYYFLQDIYRSTSRELKRLDSISRSPLYAHITESIIGMATIKSYGLESSYIDKTFQLIDANNRPYYLQTSGQRWFGLRLESLGNLLLFSVALFSIFQNFLSDSIIGLSLAYLLQVSNVLNLCIRQFAESESQFNSVERLHFYAIGLPMELRKGVHPSSSSWPESGKIEFANVEMKYQHHLPLALKGITFTIHAGEKIGVCGQTGCGKSSLMISLFRMVELSSGIITIDGQDISKLDLLDLRSRMSIIPQDPILFSGTIRSNLDPFGEYTDEALWSSLEKSGLHDVVKKLKGGLDSPVEKNGNNFSVGQRQLLCLSRAILKQTKILVLDECTANVDVETDAFIQKSLRENFKDTTVLSIAHRLHTIMDYDRIMILEQGQVVELDHPRVLVEKQDSLFNRLLLETGDAPYLKSLIKSS